ncbi:MAG: VOC family protein [Ignavibacteriaceae bacterium]|jgi:lactoylglutathione lyase
MFLGLRTAIYHVNDISDAKKWYTNVLNKEPYFDQPYYVGYNISGYELGLVPDKTEINSKIEGVVTYWGVKDAKESFQKLVDCGASIHEKLQNVGEGILVAAVKDPFGNVFGIIKNPHFSLKNNIN